MNNKHLLWFAYVALSLSIVVSVVFTVVVIYDRCIFFADGIDYEATGQVGDYFGGVIGTLFALAGTIFVVLTFNEQSIRNKRQDFETKFYEMLHIHMQNVEEMKISDGNNIFEGRATFEKMFYELCDIHNLVAQAEEKIEKRVPYADVKENERLYKMQTFLNDENKK